MSTIEHPATVVAPEPRFERAARRRPRAWPNPAAVAIAAALACSPLAFGYYDLTAWAPLGLGVAVLLVMLALGRKRGLSGVGGSATTAAWGMAALVLLSFASILWAESRESAWTSANQLAVYAAVFAVGLVAIRTRTTAWSTMVILGLPALITAMVLAAQFLIGGGAGAFLGGRLNAPIGYANGTAALLLMGSWPWLGLAERLRSRWWRGASIGAAALVASTALLTQTRAIVLAAAASIVLTLLRRPGRTRRSANLLIVLASVAAAAHWTLRVYGSTGPAHMLAPDAATLRGAGLAVLGAAGLAFLLDAGLTDRALARARGMRPGHKRHRLVTALLLLALVLSAGATVERQPILAQWHDFTTLDDAAASGNRFLSLGGGARYELWRVAVDEFAGDPIGGIGAGNYADQEFRLRRQLEHVTSPHSLELQMLAELGIGGALGLLLFAVPVLACGVSRTANRLGTGDSGLTTAALGMFTVWLAGTSVDWLYDIPGLTGMAMLAATVLLAPAAAPAAAPDIGGRPPPWRSLVLRHRWAPVALTLGIVTLLVASVGRQYVATLYRDSGASLAHKHPLDALRKLRTAEELDPWSLATQYTVASAYARLNDYPAARAALLRAERLEPENYVPPALLGDIAVRAGLEQTALLEYRRALQLDPLDRSLRRAVGAGGQQPVTTGIRGRRTPARS